MKKYLLILSFFFLFVHTLLPHEHNSNLILYYDNIENEYDVLDKLYHVISADLGVEHLEKFSPKDCKIKICVDFAPSLCFQFSNKHFDFQYLKYIDINEDISHQHISFNHQLRGPPVI